MKVDVKNFKNMKACLKECEQFIKNVDGDLMESGRINGYGDLRPREVVGNWLLCAVLCHQSKPDKFKICIGEACGDGVVYDTVDDKAYQTEHVLVSKNNQPESEDTEGLILEQISKKQARGSAYASNKELVVMLNRPNAKWAPNRVANKLPEPLDFDDVWVCALHKEINGEYIYHVTCLDSAGSPIWEICINKQFDDWKITQTQ